MEEAILEKLRKIKALADRGVDGEAEMAKKMLYQFLDKYGLKYEDVFVEEKVNDYEFSYSSKEEKKLFFHCVANVFGTKSEIWKTSYHYKNGAMKLYLKLTPFEYILFKDFYEFHREYWKNYIKTQMDLLMKAYIESQGIYDISPKDETLPKKNYSAKEIREMWTVLALSENMKDSVPQYRKAIEK